MNTSKKENVFISLEYSTYKIILVNKLSEIKKYFAIDCLLAAECNWL